MSTTCAGSLFSQRIPETEISQMPLKGGCSCRVVNASPPPCFVTGQKEQISDLPQNTSKQVTPSLTLGYARATVSLK